MTFWIPALHLLDLTDQPPRGAIVDEALALCDQDADLDDWFFQHLTRIDWFKPLAERERFLRPPQSEPGHMSWWPAGDYLARVAEQLEQDGHKDDVGALILDTIEGMHFAGSPVVQARVLRAVVSLTPRHAQRAAEIVQTRSRLLGFHPDSVGRNFSPLWDQAARLGHRLFEAGERQVAGDVWWCVLAAETDGDHMVDYLVKRAANAISTFLSEDDPAYGALFFSHVRAHRTRSLPAPVAFLDTSDADAAIEQGLRLCSSKLEHDDPMKEALGQLRTYTAPNEVVLRGRRESTAEFISEREFDTMMGAGHASSSEPDPTTWREWLDSGPVDKPPYTTLDGTFDWSVAVQAAALVQGEHATSWLCGRITQNLLQGEDLPEPTSEQIEELARAFDTALDIEEPSRDPDPWKLDHYSRAINTARAKAVEVVLRAALRRVPPPEDRVGWRVEVEQPGVAAFLTRALDPTRVYSPEVWAMLGHWLPQLTLLGPTWLDDNAHRLLPRPEGLARLRHAALGSHLKWSRPYGSVVPVVLPLLEAELEHWLKCEDERTLGEVGEAFAKHVLAYLWWGRLQPGDALITELVDAPVALLQSFMRSLAFQVHQSRDEMANLAEGAVRIRGLVDRVLASVEANPERLPVFHEVGRMTHSGLDAGWRTKLVRRVFVVARELDGVDLSDWGLLKGLLSASEAHPTQAIDALHTVVHARRLTEMAFYSDSDALLALLDKAIDEDPTKAMEILDRLGHQRAWRRMEDQLVNRARQCLSALRVEHVD